MLQSDKILIGCDHEYLNIMTGYGVWLCSFRSMLSILAASVCSQALRSGQGGESVYPSLV